MSQALWNRLQKEEDAELLLLIPNVLTTLQPS